MTPDFLEYSNSNRVEVDPYSFFLIVIVAAFLGFAAGYLAHGHHVQVEMERTSQS